MSLSLQHARQPRSHHQRLHLSFVRFVLIEPPLSLSFPKCPHHAVEDRFDDVLEERSLTCLDINLHARCRAEVRNVDCLGSVELDADDVDVGWSDLLRLPLIGQCIRSLLALGLRRSRAHALSGSPRRHPYCRRRAPMDAAAKNKFTRHSSCRRMATSSLRIHALTVPTGTRRYSAISSCVRPSMIARSRLARRFGSS